MFSTCYKMTAIRPQYEKSDSGRLVRYLTDGWLVHDAFSIGEVRSYLLRWPWWRIGSPPGLSKGYAVKT